MVFRINLNANKLYNSELNFKFNVRIVASEMCSNLNSVVSITLSYDLYGIFDDNYFDKLSHQMHVLIDNKIAKLNCERFFIKQKKVLK